MYKGKTAKIKKTIKHYPMFNKFPTNLLSLESDAKTKKGAKKGYLTGIMYLSPHKVSGSDVCTSAVLAKCAEPCLNLSGKGVLSSVQAARLRKTLFFQQYKAEFFNTLVKNIKSLERKAKKRGLLPCVRLNGTSDIAWENEVFTEKDKNGIVTFSGTIFDKYPNIQFYDYTKLPTRNVKGIANYHLTFSYSGVNSYQKIVKKGIDNGMNIAVVFANQLPETFLGLPVIFGDDDDLRFLDNAKIKTQLVVGLPAKAKAKKDNSGFVVK